MRNVLFAAMLSLAAAVPAAADQSRPIVDAHIHYSHDTWSVVPPPEAIKLLRQAGVRKAFVSSSSDDGTQMLYKAAPDLVVPVLRPYRTRGEIGTWVRDLTIIPHVEARLKTNTYAGIGEFHVFGADADLPVMRRLVELAKERKIFLHAHSDADAVERIFKQDPQARVLWAHSGFDQPDNVRTMLAKHKMLWADLAFRNDYAPGGRLDASWRQLIIDFPDRFMVGTDTPSPERWYYVVEHANFSRKWLAEPACRRRRQRWLSQRRAAGRLGSGAMSTACGGLGRSRTGFGRARPPRHGLPQHGAGLSPSGFRRCRGGLSLGPCRVAGGRGSSRPRLLLAAAPNSEPVREIKIDATMPAHGHGMNYRPVATVAAPGHYRFTGLMLHMPGTWRVTIDVLRGTKRTRLTHEVKLKP